MTHSLTHDRPVFPFTTLNRRVYTFVKQSGETQLQNLHQQILNIIHKNSPINRYELLHIMYREIETMQPVSQVLSRYERLLINFNFIRVEEYAKWKKRIELDKVQRTGALIVPDTMGGYAIKWGDLPPIGHWHTDLEVREILQRHGLDTQEPTLEVLQRIAAGE